MSKNNLKVDWASHEAAVFACKNWHYSKSIPVGKLVKVGVWEFDKFIGAVLFARGANMNMLSPYGLQPDEGCELVRVALKEHFTPVSRIMAIAIKFLRLKSPSLRLIVSYADLDAGHHGGIYQATNWIYEGIVNKGSLSAFIVHGKKTHKKTIHSKGVKGSIVEVRKHLDPNAQEFRTKGKHKYLMPLDKQMAEQIKPLAKQYPKRAKEQS